MTDPQEIQVKIMESDEFVLSETAKIQYTYGLKHETRYIIDRDEEIASESVAEHIYALHILGDYFLPLEDARQEMDWVKVHDFLQYHDIDEIETGDKIGYLKTDADRALKAQAAVRVVAQFPLHLQDKITALLREYDAQSTQEATFAKALDRIEPLFQLYNENGKKILKLQRTTQEQSVGIKEAYIKPFPYLYRFYQVLEGEMEQQGFFHK